VHSTSADRPDYWFFLSYARADGNAYLEQFYADLAREVSTRAGLGHRPPEQVGFRDTATINAGDHWPEEVAAGLQYSRVLIALQSPNFFNSEYCGREWEIFRRRQDLQQRQSASSEPAPVIIPVLWNPLRTSLPDAVANVQNSHASFGPVYAREGLSYLLRLKSEADEYQRFLIGLVDRIISVATDYAVPPLPEFPTLEQVHSAWATAAQATAVSAKSNAGPREVHFAFIAGQQAELSTFRARFDTYGQRGGEDWRPYLPEDENEIGVMAQEVVSKERLYFRPQGTPITGDDLLASIERAERDNNIFVLIVDPWTLKIPRYVRLAETYDRRDSRHAVAIAPWNLEDRETQDQLTDLERLVGQAMRIKANSGDRLRFAMVTGSAAEFKADLRRIVAKLRMRLISTGTPQRLIPASRYPARPMLTGPSGGAR
jgi:FxsC-like protein